ncbi:MAG: hypothetical protein E7430_05030 [Ruminococcaceae bacterium]|nr:hypothetical protein [Oscillospiraceae bacterium]
MTQKERPGFFVYHETEDEISYMDDRQRGQLLRALLAYSRRGEIVEDIDPIVMGSFYSLKSSVDRNAEKYERIRLINYQNGLKGGRPRKTKETQSVFSEPTATEKNHNYNSSSNSNSNPNSNQNNNYNCEREGEGTKANTPPPPRGLYKNVFLSEEEYNILRSEQPNIDERIDRLSEYMAVSGKNYVNHLATLRQWAREDGQKDIGRKSGGTRKDCENRSDYEYHAGEHEKAAVMRLQEMKRRREEELAGQEQTTDSDRPQSC